MRVQKSDTEVTSFTYDAGGQRTQALTRAGGVTSAANYLVDENTSYEQVLEERDANGDLQARYVYGQGFGPILLQRMQKNTANVNEVRTRFLLADGHGSVRQLLDGVGVVTDSYFYDAWGSGLSGGSGNTINPYRYNGQQTDAAIGGYYLRARYYQPGNGRFLGHDPLLGDDEDPVSLHRYLYAGADSINCIDPRGESISANVMQSIAFLGNMAARSAVGSTTALRLVAARAPFWFIRNAITIEFYSTLISAGAFGVSVASEWLHEATGLLLSNTQKVTSPNGAGGTWMEGKVNATATGYIGVDHFEGDMAVSLKTWGETRGFDDAKDENNLITQVRKNSKTVAKLNRFRPRDEPRYSHLPTIPGSVHPNRALLMGICEDLAHLLERPAVQDAIREVHNESGVVVRVVPIRNWVTLRNRR